MAPLPNPQQVPHRRVLRPRRTINKFGQPTPPPEQPDIPTFKDPNARILAALADRNSNLPKGNAAVIIARAALTPEKKQRENPFVIRPVVANRPILPYKIEEEEEDEKVNEFFVAAFKNISEDISQIALRFFGRHYNEGGNSEADFFEDISPLLTPTLRSYINYLADGDVGGYYGEAEWKSILRNGQEREYLFRGILHKWLEENIFDKLLFGSTKEQEGLYTVQERTFISDNGYVRTRLRSETTIAVLKDYPLPPNFSSDVTKLAEALTEELYPLHALLRPHYHQDYRGHGEPDLVTDPANPVLRTKLMKGPPHPPTDLDDPEKKADALKGSLQHLIEYAAYVHIIVRRSRNIVQIVPAFRGTPFTPEDHISDRDGTAYYKATKAIIQTSANYNERKQYPSSFPPGIDENDPPCTKTTFPVASEILSTRTGQSLGTFLQYVPYKPANPLLRTSVPILSTVAGAGFGIVGTYLAYTFDLDLPFGEGVWRGFAALPSNIVQGASVGAAIGAAASIPLSSAVAVAGTAAGFMMGALMGLVSEEGQILYWNWAPDFDELRDASWTRKKALYSGALAGALAAGVVRWVKSGIVVPENARAFYPQDKGFPLGIVAASVGVPILSNLATNLVEFGAKALATRATPYLSVSPDAIESWWVSLREWLVPLITSGSAACLSSASDWDWVQFIVATGFGLSGALAFRNFTLPPTLTDEGYISTLPASFVAATIATATATGMRYRREVTRPRVTEIPVTRIPHYRCLTRIGVIPAVRLYKAGDGSKRKNAHLNGQRIYEIQKATVLCHWGIENFSYYEGRTKIPLDQFLSQYTSNDLSLGSLFSTVGSVFTSSTVGSGENVIFPPPTAGGGGGGGDGGDGRGQPPETEEARRIRLLELENARLRAEQARDQQPQPPPRQRTQAQTTPSGPGYFGDLGTRLRRRGIDLTHTLGNSYRVTKRYLTPKRQTIPTIPRRWVRNGLIAAAGVGIIALAATGRLPRAEQYVKDAWSSVSRPDFSGLGRIAGDSVHWVSDSIHGVYDPIYSGVGSTFEGARDGLESGAHMIKDKYESGASKVKDQYNYGTDAIKDQYKSGKDTVKDQVEIGKSQIKSGAKKVKDQVDSGAAKVKDQYEAGKKQVGSGASKWKDSVEDWFEDGGFREETAPKEPSSLTPEQQQKKAEREANALARKKGREEREALRVQRAAQRIKDKEDAILRKAEEAAQKIRDKEEARLRKAEEAAQKIKDKEEARLRKAEEAAKRKENERIEAAAARRKQKEEEEEIEKLKAKTKSSQEAIADEIQRLKDEYEKAKHEKSVMEDFPIIEDDKSPVVTVTKKVRPPLKPKVTPFMDEKESQIEKNPKKRMREDQPTALENPLPLPKNAYDLSILAWVGYRGGANAIPGDEPLPKRPRTKRPLPRAQPKPELENADPDLKADVPLPVESVYKKRARIAEAAAAAKKRREESLLPLWGWGNSGKKDERKVRTGKGRKA